MYLLTGVYGHIGHHILHEKEKNRRRNTDLEYDPKEDEFPSILSIVCKAPIRVHKNNVAARTQD